MSNSVEFTRAADTHTSIKQQVSVFQHPSLGRSLWQLVDSVVPYVVLWGLAYWLMQYSYWLAIPAILLAAGFMVRIFIIFHDCGHGSFFKSPRANDIVGFITGVLTFTPYHYWRANHAKHHATSGNLDKRGWGDVWMMTVDEYRAAPRKLQLQYRLYRNPFVMLGLGPLFILLISHRFVRRQSSLSQKMSVYTTNVVILAVAAALIWLMGFKAYLAIQLPILFVGLASGVWLFYVQHQFEGVYWKRNNEWDFDSASLEGGSFYNLPVVLRWFTGNIGYHHVHHLNSRIPNYNLPKCQKRIPELKAAPTIGLFSSFKSLTFRLWDERQNRLISFGQMKAMQLDSGAE
jgi:acyl-lipid omega-6 desaturase (Delta-12 desaturase)